MKKILLLLIVVTTLFSCQITERFYLEEDGSVRFEREYNLSSMVGMMNSFKASDSTGQKSKLPIDTIVPATADLESLGLSNSKTKSEMEVRKAMDKTKIHLVHTKDKYVITTITETKNVKLLNTYFEKLRRVSNKNKKETTEASQKEENEDLFSPYFLGFSYDGKTFHRNFLSEKAGIEMSRDSLNNMEVKMASMIKYRLEYHFPKPIKSTSVENATFSIDGKTMFIEVSAVELMNNPEKYADFTVTLE